MDPVVTVGSGSTTSATHDRGAPTETQGAPQPPSVLSNGEEPQLSRPEQVEASQSSVTGIAHQQSRT